MLKILIADDAANVRDSLADLLHLYAPNEKLVASADGVKSAVKAIRNYNPDVVLLDVEMKDGTGFDVLKQFPKPSFKTIFVTAYREYALEAFNFSALDYILKPVDPEKLVNALQKANDQIDRENLSLKIETFLHNSNAANKTSKKIALKTAENIHVVNLSDIIYCEATHSYTNFYLSDKNRIIVSRTLGEFDELFAPNNFIRIHQTYLVNVDYIKSYSKNDGAVHLTNGLQLPVAVRKKDQLLQLLSKL